MIWTLEVRRSEFLEALRRVTSDATKRASQPPLLFSFSDDKLSIEALGITAEIPASGEWPGVVAVATAVLRQLIRAFPKEDPLRLEADDQKFTIARFSLPCERRSPAAPANPSFTGGVNIREDKAEPASPSRIFKGDDRRLGEILTEAGTILKPYRVSEADLKSLVEKHTADGLNVFAETEKPVIKSIAQAWSLLAPLGIEPNEIKALIDDAVKNAWNR